MPIDQKNKKLLLILICAVLLLPLAGFGTFLVRSAGDGKNIRVLDFTEGSSFRKFAGELVDVMLVEMDTPADAVTYAAMIVCSNGSSGTGTVTRHQSRRMTPLL